MVASNWKMVELKRIISVEENYAILQKFAILMGVEIEWGNFKVVKYRN